MEGIDLEAVKEQVYAAREIVYAVRQPFGKLELDERLKRIHQHLLDAEDYLDLALHEIDPNLVS
ncbi:MAG: hypothetical protein ACRDON_09815 [Gaiellaceae bacterium]